MLQESGMVGSQAYTIQTMHSPYFEPLSTFADFILLPMVVSTLELVLELFDDEVTSLAQILRQKLMKLVRKSQDLYDHLRQDE